MAACGGGAGRNWKIYQGIGRLLDFMDDIRVKEYIASLEKEFSLIENGFKEEEKRALTDYKANDNEYIKKLAFLAYKSVAYQVRMYGVFLFGYLSEQDDILTFMRDEVSKDDNGESRKCWRRRLMNSVKKQDMKKHFQLLTNGWKIIILIQGELLQRV